MSHSTLGAVAVLVLGVLTPVASAPSRAQESPATAALQALAGGDLVEVRVINLELHAVDGAGRPVGDLRLDELSLRVDGKPVPIRYFASFPVSAPPLSPTSETPTSETPAAEPRAAGPSRPSTASPRVILYVDDFFLSPPSRKRALEGVRRFLGGDFAEGTEFMLVTFDRSGLNVRQPFTTSRQRLQSALAELPIQSAEGFRRDADRASTQASIRESQRSRIEALQMATERSGGAENRAGGDDAEGTVTARQAAANAQPPCARDLLEIARIYAESEFTDVERSLHALRLFVDSLATTSGRKVLIHVSDGLPLRAGLEAFETLRVLCDGSGSRQGVQWAIDAQALASGGAAAGGILRSAVIDVPTLAAAPLEYDATPLLQEATRRANSQGLTIYPLQALGLAAVTLHSAAVDHRGSTPESEATARFNLQDTLQAMASETGGTAILQRNDFDVALLSVARDLEHYFSLGFEPPTATGGAGAVRGARSARAHTVGIETTRPGVTLRYRKSYRDQTTADDIAERLLAALFHGGGSAANDPLGIRLDLIAAPKNPAARDAAPSRAMVARLTIPTAQMTVLDASPGAPRTGFLAVHMVLQDDSGLSPIRRADVPVRLPPAAPGAAPGTAEPPYVYEVRFTAPLGKAIVAIAVEDVLSKKVTVLRRDLG